MLSSRKFNNQQLDFHYRSRLSLNSSLARNRQLSFPHTMWLLWNNNVQGGVGGSKKGAKGW